MKATMRGTFYFRPLAAALVLTVLPPDFGGLSLVQKAQAAPVVSVPAGCVQTGGSYIIQTVCTANGSAPSTTLLTAIQQFESDSIKQYLGSFSLPHADSDVAFIYQYARSDLRASIRGFIQLRMADIALRPPTAISANEQVVAEWFRARLAYHEMNVYKHALADFNSWAANHCTWSPDADVAKAYGLHYIACVGAVVANNAPSEQYYLAAARKNEYENMLVNLKAITPKRDSSGRVTTQGTPSGITMFSMSSRETNAMLGSLAGAVALVGGAMGLSQIAQIKNLIFPKSGSRWNNLRPAADQVVEDLPKIESDISTQAAAEGDSAATSDATELGAEVGEEIATEIGVEAGEVAGLSETGIGLIVGVVVIAITALVTFIVDEVNAQNQIKTQLTDQVNNHSALSYSLNLTDYYSTAEGRYKIAAVWTEANYPDAPSITALPAPDNTPLIRIPYGQPASNAILGGGTFTDWYGAVWTLHLYGGYWLNTGTNTVKTKSGTSTTNFDSISPTIRYVDWSGRHYMASRIGNNFILYKQRPEAGDVDCPASAATGLSNPSNSLACTSFVSSSINLIDGNGNKVTLAVGQLPQFPSQWVISGQIFPGFYFNNNDVAIAREVTATGYPAPTVTLDSGTLPSGLLFESGTGRAGFACCNFGTLVSGTVYAPPASPPTPGNYTVTLRATNVTGTVTQQFTAIVNGPLVPLKLELVSLPITTYFGLPVTYHFHASGPGPYHFYTNMLNGNGMTLVDLGGGLADVTGTPDLNGGNRPCPSIAQGGCAIWVSNDGTETFSYDGKHAAAELYFFQTTPPSPVVTSPTLLTFPSGRTSTFTIKTENALTPVTITAPCGLQAPWLNLTDNGDGTATLTGTAPRGTSEAFYAFKLVAHAAGTTADTTSCNAYNFTVAVDGSLSITSSTDTQTTFLVGNPGSFTITSNAPSGDIILDSTLPDGLTFSTDHHGHGTIQGTPAIGTGGDYPIHFRATDPFSGTITPAPLTLRIDEGPSLTLSPTIYLMAGVAGNVSIDPKGYPKIGDMTVLLQQGSVLPPGLMGSDVTTIASAGGINFIHGTPALTAAGKDYPLTYLITNTYGQASASTNLHIVPAGDVTHDDKVDCSDVTAVKSRIGAKAGGANYLAAADVNGDGVIDIRDLAFVSSKLATGTVCH